MSIAEADVQHEAYYWVWENPSNRSFPDQPARLVIAQACWSWSGLGVRYLVWELCGTDEGSSNVLSVVCQVKPPDEFAWLGQAAPPSARDINDAIAAATKLLDPSLMMKLPAEIAVNATNIRRCLLHLRKLTEGTKP